MQICFVPIERKKLHWKSKQLVFIDRCAIIFHIIHIYILIIILEM